MGQIGDPYVTVAEMKSYQKISALNQGNTSIDESIGAALDAASRQVEQFCGRQFNKSDVETAREFEMGPGSRLKVDDFWTLDLFSLQNIAPPDVIGGSSVAGQYVLIPRNGVVDGVPGWPFYAIEFGRGFRPVRPGEYLTVTAKWGWAEVPSTVRQATKLIANQLLRMSDAPLGVTGMDSQNGGPIRVRDLPQVAMLLNRFVSTPILVG